MPRKNKKGLDIPYQVDTSLMRQNNDETRTDVDPDRNSWGNYLDAAAFQAWDQTSHID